MFIVHKTLPLVWPNWWNNQKQLVVLSIDPGAVNFCIRLSEHDTSTGFSKTIRMFKTNINDRLHLKKTTVSNNTVIVSTDENIPKQHTDKYWAYPFNYANPTCIRLHSVFQSLKEIIPDIILIESQLSRNRKMTIIQSYCIAFCILYFPSSLLIEVSSKLKSTVFALKCTCKEKCKNSKHLATVNAKKIMELHNDKTALELLSKKGKINDFADVIVQAEAWLKYVDLIN